MEWVVGKWVKAWGKSWRIVETEHTRSKLDGNYEEPWWCNHGEMKPFSWQVGKTYRTTLDGVTATITKIDSRGDVRGTASNSLVKGNEWTWSPATGRMYGCESCEHEPHLLPFLVDEPSEPEPTLTERYTVGQLGTLWGVFDSQSMQFARFSGKEVAEIALRYMDNVDDDLTWWEIEDIDLLTTTDEFPATQPTSRYHRTIKGVTIDLYDIAAAYGVTGHAEFHAMKKIIMAGNRGYKDREQDLTEAIVSIERAREMAKGGSK